MKKSPRKSTPFKILTEQVGQALNVPVGSISELLRALREGIEASGEVHDPELDGFSGRPGPGGGLHLTARMVTFLLIGFLVDQPRAKVFDQMLCAFEASTAEGVCPLTGEKIFGDAVQAILTNEELLPRVSAIEVSEHFARIFFNGDARMYTDSPSPGHSRRPCHVSYFWVNDTTPIKGGYRIMVAPSFALEALAQLIKAVESEHEGVL
jgi:hypothetical protein